MKKSASVKIMLIVAALVLVIGSAPALAQDKPTELKMAVEQGPKGGKYILGHKPWAEMVEKATKGRVKVVIYPSSPLTVGTKAFDATIKGTTDIAWAPLGRYQKRFTLTKTYGIPGSGIKDPIIASRIIWGLYKKFPEIRKEFDDVKMLFMHAMAPFFIATTEKPIRSFSDIKGLKIGTSGVARSVLKSAGASEMPLLPLTTLASRLEKGILDGSTGGLELFKTFGLTKVANYFTAVPALTGPYFVVFMNKNKWNQLPPDIQKEIMSVSGDVGSKLYAEGDKKTSQIVMDELRAQGKEIINLSPEENAKWVDLTKSIQDKQIADLEATGLPARAVFDEILRIVEEYR